MIGAGIVIRLDEMRVWRVLPYLAAGAGCLRQHEGVVTIGQGHVYHLNLQLMFRKRGVAGPPALGADLGCTSCPAAAP